MSKMVVKDRGPRNRLEVSGPAHADPGTVWRASDGDLVLCVHVGYEPQFVWLTGCAEFRSLDPAYVHTYAPYSAVDCGLEVE